VECGDLVQCANADASLMGREKRRWFTGPTFAFLLLSELGPV
jgi:hypothetical protein